MTEPLSHEATSLPSDATGQGYVSPTDPYKARGARLSGHTPPVPPTTPQLTAHRLRQMANNMALSSPAEADVLREAARYIDQEVDDGK